MSAESERKFRRGESAVRPYGGHVADTPFAQALHNLAVSRGFESQRSLAIALGAKRTRGLVGFWYRGESVPTPRKFGQLLELLNPNDQELESIVAPWAEHLERKARKATEGTEFEEKRKLILKGIEFGVFEKLTKKQQEVLRARYLSENKRPTQLELAREERITKNAISSREVHGLARLRKLIVRRARTLKSDSEKEQKSTRKKREPRPTGRGNLSTGHGESQIVKTPTIREVSNPPPSYNALKLPTLTYNALRRSRLRDATIEELSKLTVEQLLAVQQIGRKGAREIREALQKHMEKQE